MTDMLATGVTPNTIHRSGIAVVSAEAQRSPIRADAGRHGMSAIGRAVRNHPSAADSSSLGQVHRACFRWVARFECARAD
jgi:hypothetical protein